MARKPRRGLKDLPMEERPRERLISCGISSLSNSELVAIILGTGSKKESVISLSNRLLTKYGLKDMHEISASQLKELSGIDNAKACRLMAAIEFGRRVSDYRQRKTGIKTAEDIAGIYFSQMRALKKEFLNGICMDSKLNIIKQETISVGGLNANSAHPREIFKTAIKESASAIALVHNHPSGDPNPSGDDIKLTDSVKRAGEIIGIELIDHIIIGNRKYCSLKEIGLLWPISLPAWQPPRPASAPSFPFRIFRKWKRTCRRSFPALLL